MTLPSANPLTLLFAIANRMPDQLTNSNKITLNNLYHDCLANLDDPDDLFAYVIAKAMRKNVTSQQSKEHLYLQRFEIPQIRLFELLIQHFPAATLGQRKAVFDDQSGLPLTALVLSEPNSASFEPDYNTRFTNCVHHYGALFGLIDQLPITPIEKTALKLFFSREIDDVLGISEAARVEKQYAARQREQLYAQRVHKLKKHPATISARALNHAYW